MLCPPNCNTCSLSTPPNCFECAQGFSLMIVNNLTTCAPCGRGCVSCSSTNASVCLVCQPGTYLDSSTASCLRCKQGCKEFTSLEICTVFNQGIVIISGNVVTCRPGCKVCDPASPDVCTQCQQRFFLDTGICKSCGQACQ